MTNFKHLTATELSAYSLGSLEKTESQTLGRHLLNCAECRKLLPMPNAKRFWAMVMTDDEIKDAPEIEESENFLSTLSSLLKFEYRLIWGGAALIIIFGFSFLLWLNVADSSSEVAKNFDNESGSELNFPLLGQTSVRENSTSSKNFNRTVAIPTPKNLKLASPKQNSLSTARKNPNQTSEKKLPTDKNIASTRGVLPKCEDKQSFESQAVMNGEKIVLNWEKVPNAAKYNLYISDEEEILVDEFETTEATSYVLEKPLAAGKVYKWKIIVTLENGKTVVGDSQKFSVKDLRSDQENLKRKKKSEIRCSMNN